jgi:hypothetical protein
LFSTDVLLFFLLYLNLRQIRKQQKYNGRIEFLILKFVYSIINKQGFQRTLGLTISYNTLSKDLSVILLGKVIPMADKSLTRPNYRCMFLDGGNISFDDFLVIYINSTNISPL